MKIIDTHVHPNFSDPDLMSAAKVSKVDFSLKGLLKDMREGNVERAVGISVKVKHNRECEGILKESGGKISPVAALSVENVKRQVKALDKDLKDEKFIGLKLYPGYEHFCPGERRLEPFYSLAEKHGVPVIFHSGSLLGTESYKGALLKFAHPLHVDEVATAHPEMKILIAHCGNPWFMDTAAVLEKNRNVYADTSGWFLGDMDKDQHYCATLRDMFLKFLSWAGPEKVMFGTDWPLIPIRRYMSFMRGMRLDPDIIERIMYGNALRFFWK